MSMRLFASDDPVHSEVTELLPWYVNGTLSAEQHDLVARHVLECRGCHQESLMLTRMQSVLQEDALDTDASASLNRVRRRIEAQQPRMGWWSMLRDHWRSLQKPVKWALLTQSALVCMLLMAVSWLGWMPSGRQADFHVLSANTGAVGPLTSTAQVVVVFAKDASEQDMRSTLLSMKANIVRGPTAEGAYVLAVNAARRPQILADLHRNARVVFAEPAEGTALAVP